MSAPLASFDFKHPDYLPIFDARVERLKRIRDDKSGETLAYMRTYYKTHPAQFITDWGMTADPRNPSRGLPAVIPFLLFPKQEEWINLSVEAWLKKEPLITVKSREMGVTWLAVALSVTLCIFYDGLTIGFGSRKEILVDSIGDPACIFFKIRQFISLIPKEFKYNWNERKHAPYMRCQFPHNGSVITGEAGANIGRGGRTGLFFLDESAFLERPDQIDASLSQNTGSRQDISTPNGMANSFARKVHAGNINVFYMRWQDDLRKDAEWYEKQCKYLDDPVIIAQELDCDFSASVEGVIIPAKWVQAAVDAHIKLGISPTGVRRAGLDVADEGKDKNGFAGRHGFLLDYLAEWSGVNSDIYKTVEKAMGVVEAEGYDDLYYDADGLGAAVRADARVLNAKRLEKGFSELKFVPHHGSGAIVMPKEEVFARPDNEFLTRIKGRTNEDYFENYKAQCWWHLRNRFKWTYRAVVEGLPYRQEDIISISSGCTYYKQAVSELSQPTAKWTTDGKMLVDKKPNGAKSPNLADAIVVAFAPKDDRKGFYSC